MTIPATQTVQASQADLDILRSAITDDLERGRQLTLAALVGNTFQPALAQEPAVAHSPEWAQPQPALPPAFTTDPLFNTTDKETHHVQSRPVE